MESRGKAKKEEESNMAHLDVFLSLCFSLSLWVVDGAERKDQFRVPPPLSYCEARVARAIETLRPRAEGSVAETVSLQGCHTV